VEGAVGALGRVEDQVLGEEALGLRPARRQDGRVERLLNLIRGVLAGGVRMYSLSHSSRTKERCSGTAPGVPGFTPFWFAQNFMFWPLKLAVTFTTPGPGVVTRLPA
jgi:hypothetical protein